jgi:hypothetical protein
MKEKQQKEEEQRDKIKLLQKIIVEEKKKQIEATDKALFDFDEGIDDLERGGGESNPLQVYEYNKNVITDPNTGEILVLKDMQT